MPEDIWDDKPTEECGVFGIFAPGHDVASVPHQVLEERELLRRQIDAPVTALDDPRHRIECQVGDDER